MDKPSLLYPPIPVGHGLSKQFKTKTRITRTINQKNKRYENQRTPPTASILPPHATPLKKKKKLFIFTSSSILRKKNNNKNKINKAHTQRTKAVLANVPTPTGFFKPNYLSITPLFLTNGPTK